MKKLCDASYLYASKLMYEFFDINYVFFYEFLNIFDKFNRSHCLKINKLKKKFGPYDNSPFRMALEIYGF